MEMAAKRPTVPPYLLDHYALAQHFMHEEIDLLAWMSLTTVLRLC